MSVRAFEHLETGMLLSSTQSAAYRGPLLGSANGEASLLTAERDGLTESPLEGPRCIKGILMGIGLEVLAAFSIYGVWHLVRTLHLFR